METQTRHESETEPRRGPAVRGRRIICSGEGKSVGVKISEQRTVRGRRCWNGGRWLGAYSVGKWGAQDRVWR